MELEKACRGILHEVEDAIWRNSWHGEYMSALKLEVDHLAIMDQAKDLINLKNGMLDLCTLTLMPHAPEYYSTVQIPINYNPEATCSGFHAFLESIFDEDQERIALVQEIMGYCLTKDVRLQKAFIFHGIGSNGKSVLANVICHMVGKENTSHVPLSRLSERFGLDNLPGKTVNISTENELGEKHFNTQNFKSITGTDVINVEQKYKDSFSCRLFCKLIVLANKLPTTKDHSHGFYRRIVIVPFNRVFIEKEQDKNFLAKLLTELDGILSFALRGYQRLVLNNHQLTVSSFAEKALAAYKEQQNPVLLFMREQLTFVPEESTERKLVYPAFQRWARKNDLNEFAGITRQAFWNLFRAGAAEVGYEPTTKKIQGNIYLNGVALNEVGKSPKRPIELFD